MIEFSILMYQNVCVLYGVGKNPREAAGMMLYNVFPGDSFEPPRC